jgi:autotransporter-associated beta strand protein
MITGASAGGVYVAWTNASSGAVGAALDMSGLGTFIISNVPSTATMQIGNGGNRSDGTLYLAKTNYIALSATGTGNSAALVVGNNTGNNGNTPGGVLYLGQTNTILADNIGVGLSKQTSATVRFNPALGNSNPYAYIRGFSGTAVKRWAIGDGQAQSGTSAGGSGICTFTNGTVNAVVSVMVLGRPSSTSGTNPVSAGTLSFSAGNISVALLTNAMMTTVAGVAGSAPATNQTATGTIAVTGTGTFNVNNAVMAILLGTGGSSTGTINVTNGTFGVGILTTGGGTSTINVDGGTFNVTNSVGTPSSTLTALNLVNANVHLNLDASANVPSIATTSVGTSGTSTISIDSIANYPGGTVTIKLISYTGIDPYASLQLGTIPSGYSNPILVDDTANNSVDLTVTSGTVVTPPVDITWNGGSATGNTWSDAANWNGTALEAGDTLFFDGNNRLNNVNDTAAGTTYSNITFNATAGAFLLNGNSINLALNAANVLNSSSEPQTVNLGLSYNGNITLTGGNSSAPLIIGGVLANTSTGNGVGNITLVGTGIITNLFANSGTDTNSLVMNGAANWTILNNSSSTAINATNLGLTITNGSTLNFGNAGSAPSLTTSTVGQGSDNVVGDAGTAASLNVANGTLTLGRRLNTANGNINVLGGTLNVWSQIQMDNSASGNVGNLSVTGGTLDVLNTSGGSIGGGTIYVASRGTGTFTIGGANTLAECAILDISRNAVSGTVGTVSLNGGTLKVGNKISTATANASTIGSQIPSATFYFNGGTLQPNISSGTVPFQGNITNGYATPIMAYVQAGGAIINTPANKNLFFGEMLMHDSSLLTPDGGLTKQGVGILTLASNATYNGNTTISAGTLQLMTNVFDTANIIIGSSATFDLSALVPPLTLAANQTLTNSGTTGNLVGNLDLGAGSLGLTYASGTPALTVTTSGALATISSATLTLNNNPITVSISGSPLAAGSYLLISAGPGGFVAGSVTALPNIIGAGVTDTASLKIVGNQLYLIVGKPVANPLTVTRPAGINALKIALTDLATNWSDANGGTVSFVSVNNSTNGATVVTNGGYVLYSNANNVNDQFTYVIEDSYGFTATGVVNVVVGNSGVFGQTSPSITTTGGAPTLGFAGIPGYSYSVQVSTDLVNWSTIWTTNAPPSGVFQFTDNSAPQPAAYYRLQWNP